MEHRTKLNEKAIYLTGILREMEYNEDKIDAQKYGGVKFEEDLQKRGELLREELQRVRECDCFSIIYNMTEFNSVPSFIDVAIRNHVNKELDNFVDKMFCLKDNKAKQVKEIDDNQGYFKCPDCETLIYYSDNKESHKFCLNCGQKLDWGVARKINKTIIQQARSRDDNKLYFDIGKK